ncbi:5-bromo-4-chloroindolyl phosphate hydrolysis family protein [Aliiroseovarius sp. PTFE2010]|uniref:5-bromo-4-chloroindolyl phosphate hydrolysis family protein n=1 Tax=Aliiroseovarius sp. PTFE2010 TaxID=3417190 RepID=UPI003CE7BF26
MAQRYGGQHSPERPLDSPPQPRPFDGKTPTRIATKSNLLFLAPLPLALRAFWADPLVMVQYLGAFALLELAAWLTREGLRAEEAYDARTVARRPAIPRKLLASALIAAGLGLTGLAGHGPLQALVFALLGGGLHLAAFGPDPLKNKGMDGIDDFQQDRVARVVDQAEDYLAAMQGAIKTTGDRALIDRVARLASAAKAMCRRVEEDPRDLSAARKYLGVYLLGARDATRRYASLHTRHADASARADYLALLDDLESEFSARTEALMLEERSNLDIEISVLRDRLAREGIRIE